MKIIYAACSELANAISKLGAGVMTHIWTLPACEAIVGEGLGSGLQPCIRTLSAAYGRGSGWISLIDA